MPGRAAGHAGRPGVPEGDSVMKKVIITAAVVGTAHMASMSPYFPVKPEDIIQ